MFERFTERARHVVVLAQHQAFMLKHDYIGTEHIFLGLLREKEGLAALVLESLDITYERVRAQVVRIVGSGEEITARQIPFTPRAKKLLELAQRESIGLNQNYIGTEHLLLGLLREPESMGARILLSFDADSERIRNKVISMLAEQPREGLGRPADGERVMRRVTLPRTDPLLALQEWYARQCDGEWEHNYGVAIDTLDNPGWSVRIDLRDTAAADKTLERTESHRSEHDWLVCWTEGAQFHATCGPRNLAQALDFFLRWVD